MLLRLRWALRLVRDIVLYGVVNRSPLTSGAILALLVLGLLISAAQISAPFIYTLF